MTDFGCEIMSVDVSTLKEQSINMDDVCMNTFSTVDLVKLQDEQENNLSMCPCPS